MIHISCRIVFLLFWLHTAVEGAIRNQQSHERDSGQVASWRKSAVHGTLSAGWCLVLKDLPTSFGEPRCWLCLRRLKEEQVLFLSFYMLVFLATLFRRSIEEKKEFGKPFNKIISKVLLISRVFWSCFLIFQSSSIFYYPIIYPQKCLDIVVTLGLSDRSASWLILFLAQVLPWW